MTALKKAALAYAQRGWPVFPLGRGKKTPVFEGAFHRATTDLEQVAAWWDEYRDANIGCPPGGAGVVVFDWDSEAGQVLARKLGLYAEPTLIVETARGEHIYGKHPGFHIRNQKLAKVLDVRADAGYVLLPPSVHPTGAIYRAHGKISQIRDLPLDVVELLRQATERASMAFPEASRPEEPPVDAGTPRRRAYVVAAIEAECMELANTGEGDRNNALNRAAFSLARFVGTGEADPDKLAHALRVAAQHAGLEGREVERTIVSAFRAREVAV